MNRNSIFTVGGTVQAGRGRYVARDVDDVLLELCRAGTFAFVLSARQMGKSSLMVHTAHRLLEEGTRSLIIDLSQIGVQVDPDSWYLSLLTRAEDRLDLETDVYEWWESHAHLSYSQRLTTFFHEVALTEIQSRLVIFIDEIDSTLDLEFTDDFFAAIRYVYNARSTVPEFNRLSFVLIGVATPNDLISDPRRTPFNIGQEVDVGYFSTDEAMLLAEGFPYPRHQARQVLNWILEWTNGHPYLTQRLCVVVAERNPDGASEGDIEAAVAATFLEENAERDSNIRFVNDMLTRWAPDRVSVLQTYRRILDGRKVPDDKKSPIITQLKLAGVVQRSNGHLRLSSPVYGAVFDRSWVRRQWPEHWIKRVPPAVLGLVVTAFVATVLLALFVIQTQRAGQAQERTELQEQLNSRLRSEIEVSDSLRDVTDDVNRQLSQSNEQLLLQAQTSDSLRWQEEATNISLLAQIAVSDSLREETESINSRLSEQVRISDSLRNTAEGRLREVRDARLETITIALANKALRQLRLGDIGLGALLARQAYLFSLEGSGEFLDPVYSALIQSLDELAASGTGSPGGPMVIADLPGEVRSLAYSPDGRLLAIGNEDGTLTLRNQRTGSLRRLEDHDGPVRAVVFSPDGESIVSGGVEGAINIWRSIQEDEPVKEERHAHNGSVRAIAFAPDGDMVASAGAGSTLKVWARKGHQLVEHATLDLDAPTKSLLFTADGTKLVAGGIDGIVRVWDRDDLDSPPARWDTGQGSVNALAFDRASGLLATGGTAPPIRLWRGAGVKGEPLIYRTLHGHEGPVNALAFSRNGSMLASGSADRSVQLWQASNFERNPILLQDHTGWVWTLAFSPIEERLASGAADRTVRIWSTMLDELAARICEAVEGRELTPSEWREHVGNDFTHARRYQPCVSTAQVESSDPSGE